VKRYLYLAVVALVSACAFGCGDDAPKAEPKFKEPPKATIGQIDEKGGIQSGSKVGEKPK
jgi:hypothetical protein